MKSTAKSASNCFEDGIECFRKMNGMFGIAIWDERKQKLVLARDRLGIKPLYYYNSGENLIFASEIKSILESGLISPEINAAGLEEYFVFRFIAGEKTIFKNIYSLPPGHILIWENGKIEIRKFWDLPDSFEQAAIGSSEAIRKLDELLNSSVDYRLMSDVPLGTFCSGGVDSSLTSAYAAGMSNTGLNTFSVGFAEKDFDESRFAFMVSQKFGTKHHVIEVDNKDFADNLPHMIWHNDEPLNHANSVQIYLISKLAREHVTVVLTGEGSDELFGGYPRYLISKIYAQLYRMPGFIKSAIRGVSHAGNMRRLSKLAQILPLDCGEMAVMNASFIDRDEARSVLADFKGDDYIESRLALLPGRDSISRNPIESVMRLDLKTYLVSILNRQDKMSMAASIESRVPFLDHRLVEWAITVPPNLKLDRFNTKMLVKRLGGKYLPGEIVNRKKSGFGVPMAHWLRDRKGMGRYLDIFSEEKYAGRGYINVDTVRGKVKEHLSGRFDHGELLWELISLELWHRIFIEGENI